MKTGQTSCGSLLSTPPTLPPVLAADHVSHLENVSEEEINRLLGMVVDVENLFMSVHKEEDTDTKQVYFYLFKVSFLHVQVSEPRGGGWGVCSS